jgi:hypothetical protein
MKLPMTATAPSTPTDQRVRLVIEAEIFQDPDGGPDSLIVTTDELACEPTVPARFLRMIEEGHAKLNAMKLMALEYEARDTLAAIIAEHDLTLIEVDMRTVTEFAGDLADRLGCWAGRDNDRVIVWVPAGQDPFARTNAVADLVNDPHSVVREG